MSTKRIKVMRVVTAPEAVSFHLRNTLEYIENDFDTLVVGSGVTRFASSYPNIKWIDVDIPRAISFGRDLKSIFSLYKVIRQEKPDIVHSIMPKAGLVSALAGFLARVPTRVHTFTGQVWANKTGFTASFLKALDRLVVFLSTHVFTDSPSQSQFLFENNVKFLGEPIPFLGAGSLAGVDTIRFDRDRLDSVRKQFREKHHWSNEDVVFSFVGRKCRDKGIFELVQSFSSVARKHKNAYLLLVGPDESGEELTSALKGLGDLQDRVVNIGIVSNVEEYLVASDVFCLPSYREGFGTVVLEAGALHIATIGTKINGLIDSVVDGVTGVLVAPQSSSDLEKAMNLFLETPNVISYYGGNAFARVKEHFDSKIVYKSLSDFYKSSNAKGVK